MHGQQARRSFDVERKGERRPYRPKPATKPKRWSHQDDLDTLKGKPIDIILSGRVKKIRVVLLEADQFALQVVMLVDDTPTGNPVTIFKHSIECYGAA